MSGVKEKYTTYAIHCAKLKQYKRTAKSQAASDELTVVSVRFFLVVNLLIS